MAQFDDISKKSYFNTPSLNLLQMDMIGWLVETQWENWALDVYIHSNYVHCKEMLYKRASHSFFVKHNSELLYL